MDVMKHTATSEGTLHSIYEELNRTSCFYPKEQSIPDLFAQQVAQHRDQVAVVFEGQTVTYGELDERSGQLAFELHQMGIGHGDFVAICVRRGVEMLTALYAVLKAGAAYVPLDPDYPRDRMNYILQDCEAKAVLLSQCSLDCSIPTIDLQNWYGEDGSSFAVQCKPDDPAYLIYTSGTTGKPKGVVICHKNVINYSWQSDYGVYRYGTEQGYSSILSVTNYVFDIFVTEAITSLLNGMTVYMANDEEQRNVRAFSSLVMKYKPEVLQTTPSRIRLFLAQDPECQALGQFRYMMLGGEVVSEELITRLRDLCPNTILVNVYGPSETTVWSTCADVTHNQATIGTPISNTRVYILDGSRLCATGEIGEFCIAGDGVSPGYLNRPELTEEKFISDPYGEGFLYRTGDLAALESDGMIHFYGRADDQVKILGHRIELTEIDSAIRRVDGIRDCAVIVREDGSGEKRIYAYFCSDQIIESRHVSESLMKSLPDYMLPSGMLQLPSIPLNASGKVDRKALPSISVESTLEYTAPETEEQKLLCELFSQIFGIEKVGIHDSFFHLGGHSITVAVLLRRIEEEFSSRLSHRSVFMYPTPAMLAELLKSEEAVCSTALKKAEEKAYYPLSSAQMRMYLSQSLEEDSLQYHLPEQIRIRGAVDVPRLRVALQTMIARHESLRTQFVLVNGEPMQIIVPYAQENFEFIIDHNSSEDTLTKGFLRPFDLAAAPLLRMKLIERDSCHLLLMDMHHIVSDGMSVELFWEEFFRLYAGEELPELEFRYRDYSESYRNKDLSAHREFWLGQFDREVVALDLPLDQARSSRRSLCGATLEFTLEQKLSDDLRSLCREHGSTEYMVFLSAAMILFGKYSRQEDVVIGTAFSGRDCKETQNMLGMFVNTLAMRGEPKTELSYSDFLKQIKDLSLKAMEYQDYPFEDLVNAVAQERDLARNPLFDVMLVYHNQDQAQLSMGSATLERSAIDTGCSAFDLTFQIEKHGKSHRLSLQYASDLFHEETAKRMVEHYLYLLRQICSNSDRTIGEYCLVTPMEQTRIREFNHTQLPFPEDETITSLFEQQVTLHSDRTALRFGTRTLSYGELNASANYIGHKLREIGICPGDLVALYASRSLEAFAGILGILKSGGAYLPMDPELPQERLDFMFADSGCKAVVYVDKAPSVDLPMLCVDLKQTELKPPKAVNVATDLAYCIYTSGTTGKPKGVLIEHIGICSLKQYFIQAFQVDDSDRILQFANLVFDASVWEWTMALLNGAELVICTQRNDLAAFEQEFVQQGITVATLPPNFYIQLNQIHPRLLITAGSASDQSILRKAQGYRYVNAYGPTETTICATAWERQGNPSVPPIGKPIANMQAYVLNGLTPCAIGEIGELCISGIGLARGYLNREELTAQRFIPDPFGEGRLYRTGDLVRWLPNGNILFLGRLDDQVKLRGFRVELGEIEAVLRELPEVREAAVLLRKDSTGDSFLCAYYGADCELPEDRLKMQLARSLPEYMIPAYFVRVPTVPVNSSGKVDQRALPMPVSSVTHEYIAPRTEIEKFICELFSHILGVDRVSVKDSFFALGGHSLRAAKLANDIWEGLHCRIPVSEIFAAKSPERIAAYLQEASFSEREQILPIPVADSYPMSPAQKRMFLVQQMDPHGISYNMPAFWHIKGNVDVQRLEKSFAAMIQRHESLRTVFRMEGEEAVQIVMSEISVPFRCTTWDGEVAYQRSFVRPFDLERGPLVRMELLHKEQESILMLDIHHIIADGLSVEVFCKELSMLYCGRELPATRIQYKDYSHWILQQDTEAAGAYWREQLAEPPILDLPLDHARPQQQSFDGATVYASLTKELSEKLSRLSKELGITDYMLFLSGAMVLMSKYSRQEDIVIGSAYSGRTATDTEDMIGMFVNTLALRAYPKGDKTCADFIAEIRQLCMDAYKHQNYPFEDLVDSLKHPRDPSRNPLFDVMIAMQNSASAALSLGELEVCSIPYHNEVAKFDLNFLIEESQSGYILALEYCTAMFREETAQGLLQHYIVVLEQLLQDPQRKLREISAITETEKREILYDFNLTDAAYPTDATLVTLFESQVRKTPDRIAVVFEHQQLTYRELNARANVLAKRLRQQGVGRDTLVPMFIERGLEMVIGIYGILKAGGAYVPINTSYPRDRVEFILQDCGASLILVGNTPLPVDDSIEKWNLINMDYEAEDTTGLQPINKPADLAYIIYTSGTTGKPKGVMIEHRNVVRLMNNSRFQFDFCEEDVWMMFHSYGFDFSVWEMYGATLFGGKLVVVSEDAAKDSAALRQLMLDEGVTILNQVPSSFYNLQRSCNGEEGFAIRYLIFGGEALHPAKLEPWHRWFPHCKIINMYGITETTVHVTYREIGDREIQVGLSDIGSAIPTLKAYVMQGNFLCGIGVPGELCVAGDGLARGYLHRTELTQEKFVPNPFGVGRLYRSGDLARWLPDGNLEYLGRIDEQVKIRGFRIELGEIETALRHCEAVRDCAVIVRKDSMGENAIFAYAVSDEALDFSRIRDTLRRSMPEYMIPSYMMQIRSLPVTRNGKLDRQALPSFTGSGEQDYLAPRDDLERKLCDCFSKILGVERISISDSFFELGGHSLRAVELANTVGKLLGCNLNLKDIFLCPSVELLGAYIREQLSIEDELPIAENRMYYPMSAAQKRIYFVCAMDDEGTSYNMPQLYALSEALDVGKLQMAFRKMLARHEILRTAFHIVDGEAVQQIQSGVEADLELCEDLESTEVDLIREFVRPFALSVAPLIRGRLIRRKQGYLFALDMHHIISDGISSAVFIEELSALYNGQELPMLQRQYKDFSCWMYAKDLSADREYWLDQFRDEIPVLELTLDAPRPQKQSFCGAVAEYKLSPSLTEKLCTLGNKEGATEYMLYMAAAAVLLSKYSCQGDLVLGTVAAGRSHFHTQRMLGMFVNTLALRVKPEGNKTFRSFLREVKELVLNAFEHQNYPFEDLVDQLQLSGDGSRNPLFDVMFAMEHEHGTDLDLSGVNSHRCKVEQTIAKFDLTFQINRNAKEAELTLEYNTDLFLEATARRMLEHYHSVLLQILEQPDRCLASIEALTAEERIRIYSHQLAQCHDTTICDTLVGRFEKILEQFPNHIALVDGEERFSYDAMNRRINSLAWKLKELGVRRGDLVAILPRRGWRTIVAVCAVLKAGAAYVPIDPGYPEQRIRDILEDCDPKAILTYDCRVESEKPTLE
ncbi:MAG: amino acid adenylation domain-containing protein, partial [Oscillospiraceae bacterium]|nr:amino acid adenylation domain-containing protein [Oscillospiraceae bacterium]